MFKNPNKSAIETTVTRVVGVAVGVMVSRGVLGLVHEDQAGLDTTAAKKQNLIKIGKRVAIAGGAGYAAAGISGKDTASIFVESFAIGASAVQVFDGVKDLAVNSPKMAALASGTKTEKALAKTLGLGCPCESTLLAMPLNRPSRRSRLNSPALVAEYNAYQPMLGNPYGEIDPLQAAINTGFMSK